MKLPRMIAFRNKPTLHRGGKFIHNGHEFTIEKFHAGRFWITFNGYTDRLAPDTFFAAFGPSLPGWDSKIHR